MNFATVRLVTLLQVRQKPIYQRNLGLVQVRLTLYREKARQSYFIKRKTYCAMNDSPKILRFTAYVLRGLFAMCQSNFPDF